MALLASVQTALPMRDSRVFFGAMKTLEQIEADVRELSLPEQEKLREWLDNLLEESLELKEEFKAEIEAAKKDIAEGRYRIHKP
jgi:hypothetical protein